MDDLDLDLVYRAIAGDVYHTDARCPIGRCIPPEWRVTDNGGLPICPACNARSMAERQRRRRGGATDATR